MYAADTYNDVALKALDRVMAKAAAHGLRVTLVPLTNWDGPDNKATVCGWVGCKWGRGEMFGGKWRGRGRLK